jgi:predicted nucleic acid-binding protein
MNVVIDTNVFLNVIRAEPGLLEASEELLRRALRGEVTGLASSVALIEVRWVLHEKKEFGKSEKAVAMIEEIVDIVSVDGEIAKEAIDIKIERSLELLDSIHAVSAASRNAVLVTRDDDLRRRVEDIVRVNTPEQVLVEIKKSKYPMQ